MMDISRATSGPIVAREGRRLGNEADRDDSIRSAGAGGETSPSPRDDEKGTRGAPKIPRRRKFRDEEDQSSGNSKKRRKQLKPIRIATNLDEMVKVPKQITVGLNNDLDNVIDTSHAVPKNETGTISATVASAAGSMPDASRALSVEREILDKPEMTEINVPNLEMGPNFIANPNFIFPFPFQPVKNPHFWSDANLKIFNQEAYCELCKKEFCNKYFLKTHKANKHGIYVDFPSGAAAAVAGAGGGSSKHHKSDGKLAENGKNVASASESECERAFCELCNKRFCNKYFVRRHKTKSHGMPDEETQHGMTCPDAERSPAAVDGPKSIVEAIALTTLLAAGKRERDFDNQTEEMQEGPLNLIVKEESDEGEVVAVEEDEDAASRAVVGDAADECSSENIEKLQTMLLRLNPSEVDGKMCKFCNEAVADASSEHRCPTQEKTIKGDYLSEANDSSNESKNDFPLHKTGESHDFLYASRYDHLKQTKPTSSYCDICNKELCNKYFMRTHMQRMHGIEIEHGTQIGGVVCNICNKELCSKYFLRVHKQNSHGIVGPSSLVGASASGNSSGSRIDPKSARSDPRFAANFSQVCYICNKRFRSPKWLQAHVLSDHRDVDGSKRPGEDSSHPSTTRAAATPPVVHEDEPEERSDESVLRIPPHKARGQRDRISESPEALDVISKLFWENNSSSKSYGCSRCPFTTSVLAFLFVHERSHFVLPPQDHASDSATKPSMTLQSLLHDRSFWQRKITQQISECLDLSSGKSKFLSFEQNGS